MIALLTGQLVTKEPSEVILDVSGVGYHLAITLQTYEELPEVGKDTTLQVFTYVREETLALYGFASREEKEVFIKLLKVSGIGPKLALAILSGVPPHDFVTAVQDEDFARLNAIPGVGRKTAERIIVDLKGKLLTTTLISKPISGNQGSSKIYDDALSALLNLGYNKGHAEKALGTVGVTNKAQLSQVIRDVLKELSNI